MDEQQPPSGACCSGGGGGFGVRHRWLTMTAHAVRGTAAASSPQHQRKQKRNKYCWPYATLVAWENCKPPRSFGMDLAMADVVISIGCDVTGLPLPAGTLRKWDDVPSPSEDFT